ncbi:hypothetical protein HCN51_03295 [Nonomuraea sp. FMUSA5-5]|uniref:Uncharacterized protein n=1 Tax=Nonomuraea composti TaxID=2720023 RepID=A0ABX1AVV7_9ACTN|nr:hypothetical protein [Nonomuraea sp. FMUSA5-5]NJP88490.1 hypothetical protein [Nonomuraea sp. FMUSA5-5]
MRAPVGGIDPLGATIGLVSPAVSVPSLWLTWRGLRLQREEEAGAVADRLAVKLMIAMLRERRPGEAVPVRLSAAAKVVERRLVVPMIDGLDEMDRSPSPEYASRAGHAIRALNDYRYADTKADVVVTCRSGHYEALAARDVRLRDAARVKLRPLRPADIAAFLRGRADDPGRWRPVLDAVRAAPAGVLACGLRTPWRLTAAAVVYEQRDPDGAYARDPAELLALGLATEEAIRAHLAGWFVHAAVRSHPGHLGYTVRNVQRWLSALAGHLDEAGGGEVGSRPARAVAAGGTARRADRRHGHRGHDRAGRGRGVAGLDAGGLSVRGCAGGGDPLDHRQLGRGP